MQLSPCSCSPQKNLRRQRSQRLTRLSTRRHCSLTMTHPLTMTPPQPQRAPMQPPRGRPLSPAGRRSARRSRAAPAYQPGRSGRPGAIAINSSWHRHERAQRDSGGVHALVNAGGPRAGQPGRRRRGMPRGPLPPLPAVRWRAFP